MAASPLPEPAQTASPDLPAFIPAGAAPLRLEAPTTDAEPRMPSALKSLVRHRFRAKHFGQSLGFALAGLRWAVLTQANFRTHLLIAAGVIAAGVAFQITVAEWLPLLVMVGLVLAAEAFNTALEFTVDLVTQGEFDMRAKIIKDLSAGACLMLAVTAVVIGALVFWPHCVDLIRF